MNQKLSSMRGSPKPSPHKTLAIRLGSGNGCDISNQNQIRTRRGWQLRDYTAAEQLQIEARFWAQVKKSDACWLWQGSRDSQGYGHLGTQHAGRFTILKTHRLGWELAYGPIPKPLQINHHCDVRHCVRPAHLFLGTQDDNLKDAARKGRLHRPRTRVLSQADRLAIYHMPDRRGLGIELALHYRVSEPCISVIRRGRFVGSPFERLFVRVPHRDLPVRGEVA